MLQLALLAALTSLAIGVVSAQDPVVFNTSSPHFGGSLSRCRKSAPVSCGEDGDPPKVDLCCYESPVSYILIPYQYLGAVPKLTRTFKGLLLQTQVRQGERG
jgi:hypothetical protein